MAVLFRCERFRVVEVTIRLSGALYISQSDPLSKG